MRLKVQPDGVFYSVHKALARAQKACDTNGRMFLGGNTNSKGIM